MISSGFHSPFRSFFQAGFECSTHRLRSGRRLDVIAATGHDRFIRQDYERMLARGLRTAREGLRWHLAEPAPYRYDFASAVPMLRAARDLGIQTIWDLCHYGYPDDLDPFRPEFLSRYAALVRAFARVVRSEMDEWPYFCPMNEISFFAWAGGDTAYINPFATGRGDELKRALVRANIAACEALWEVLPGARIAQVDPLIHIHPRSGHPEDPAECAAYNEAQYQGWDMLAGRLAPELGGNPKYLDLIGVNFYWKNQWIHFGPNINRTDPRFVPFADLIEKIWRRYQRPLFVAETGTEDNDRGPWFSYMCGEVRSALERAVPVHGICLYPIVNHPGWDDDRHCHNGLWDYPDDAGNRPVYEPLAAELTRQTELFDSLKEHMDALRPGVPVAPALGLCVSEAAAPDEPVRA